MISYRMEYLTNSRIKLWFCVACIMYCLRAVIFIENLATNISSRCTERKKKTQFVMSSRSSRRLNADIRRAKKLILLQYFTDRQRWTNVAIASFPIWEICTEMLQKNSVNMILQGEPLKSFSSVNILLFSGLNNRSLRHRLIEKIVF